jgi:hypothetical protein
LLALRASAVFVQAQSAEDLRRLKSSTPKRGAQLRKYLEEGEPARSGAYELSSVSTVSTAPHPAGGPNAQASLRNVTVMRGRGAVRRPMCDELQPAEGMVDDEITPDPRRAGGGSAIGSDVRP